MVHLLVRCARFALHKNCYQCCKTLHTQKTLHATENHLRKSIRNNAEVKKFRSYIVTRYMDYVQSYEKVIEKKFPTALHLYRTFKVGMKEFYRDLVSYVKIIRKLNTTTDGLKSLTLSEIEIYHKMPKDMIKVAPVLFLSALPFTNYIIFPLAYFYPRQMLCSHFWTLQQRSEFQVHYLKKRLLNYRPTFRCMQAELDSLKEHRLYCEWSEILGLIGSGVQPSVEQIVYCRDLFADEPYGLSYLKDQHLKNLLRMHSLNGFLFRPSRLREHAKLLRAMDRVIVREGGVQHLSQDAIRTACFIRGLNPSNVRYEDLTDWLEQWLAVSHHLENEHLSLLMHCPILLGYNQPSNWILIY